MTEAAKHRGERGFSNHAITACCCVFPSDKCKRIQEELRPNEMNSFQRDARCDYRLCGQENVRRVEQTLRGRKEKLQLSDPYFSVSPRRALRRDGMTAADGKRWPSASLNPMTLFTRLASISPCPDAPSVPASPVPGPVCSSATCQQDVRPRCPAHRGSHPILLYHIML